MCKGIYLTGLSGIKGMHPSVPILPDRLNIEAIMEMTWYNTLQLIKGTDESLTHGPE